MKVGYIKPIKNQSAEEQSEILILAGCTKIFTEQNNCSDIYKRDKLDAVVEFVKSDDTLVVSRVIVCCRSLQELYRLLNLLQNKQVQFLSVEQNISQPLKLIPLLELLSQFELDLKQQRVAEGVVKAMNNGVKFGRKRKLDNNKVSEAISLKALGYTYSEVANRFDVGVSTLFRYLAERRVS